MGLEDKDIVRTDATVIVGVLILLTLSIGFAPSEKNQDFYRLFYTLAIIAPFALSAVLAILTNFTGKSNGTQSNGKLIKASKGTMAIGFGYIIFILGYLMLSSLNQSK